MTQLLHQEQETTGKFRCQATYWELTQQKEEHLSPQNKLSLGLSWQIGVVPTKSPTSGVHAQRYSCCDDALNSQAVLLKACGSYWTLRQGVQKTSSELTLLIIFFGTPRSLTFQHSLTSLYTSPSDFTDWFTRQTQMTMLHQVGTKTILQCNF